MLYSILSLCRAAKAAGCLTVIVLVQLTFIAVPTGFAFVFGRTLPTWLAILLGVLAAFLWAFYFGATSKKIVRWTQREGQEALTH